MNPARQVKERIMPGVWIDMNGDAHFSIPQILAECGMEDTIKNRRLASEAVLEMIREKAPDKVIVCNGADFKPEE